jgi:DNA processing protein
VVEAARRSGSLITARFAVEQGREVFAVPGSPLDPRAEGTNDLIRQGATLCSRAEDVIEELRGKGTHAGRTDLFDRPEPEEALDPLFDELDFFAAPPSPRFAFENQSGRSVESPVAAPAPVAASDPRGLILELLGPAPVSVNDLARASGLPAHIVQRVLVELDVAGKLTRHDSETVSIVCGPIT